MKKTWYKHLLFAATLALGMTSPAWASDLGVSTNSVDFGSFNEGPVASKEVTLINNGKETLVIKNVTSN